MRVLVQRLLNLFFCKAKHFRDLKRGLTEKLNMSYYSGLIQLRQYKRNSIPRKILPSISYLVRESLQKIFWPEVASFFDHFFLFFNLSGRINSSWFPNTIINLLPENFVLHFSNFKSSEKNPPAHRNQFFWLLHTSCLPNASLSRTWENRKQLTIGLTWYLQATLPLGDSSIDGYLQWHLTLMPSHPVSPTLPLNLLIGVVSSFRKRRKKSRSRVESFEFSGWNISAIASLKTPNLLFPKSGIMGNEYSLRK